MQIILAGKMIGRAVGYLKGIRGNAQVHKFINGTDTADELRNLLNGFVEEVIQCDEAELSVGAF